jgi:hypothetical protein
MFERLEDRFLLGAGGIWVIFGDKTPRNLNDTIVIDRDPDNSSVLRATVNGAVVGTRDGSSLSLIYVYSGRGDDYVRVDTSGGRRLVLTVTNGGPGSDTLIGGPQVDYIFGGTGDDTIRGGGGKDFLFGGLGKDYVYAEPGVSNVYGDRADMLVQDAGANPLQPVGTDDALRTWLITAALERYGGILGAKPHWWWDWWRPGDPILYAMDAAGGPKAGGWGSANTGPDSYSGTNNQVAGVDEADFAKTDGNYIYLLHEGEMVIADSWPADALHIEGRAKIEGFATALYVYGDRVTVLSQVYDQVPLPDIFDKGDIIPLRVGDAAGLAMPGRLVWRSDPQIKVTVFDVSDRSAPTVAEETYLDGWLVDSRAIEDRVVLVMQNDSPIPEPLLLGDPDNLGTYVYESKDSYVDRLRTADLDALLPGYKTKVAGADEAVEGALVEAPALYMPAQPSGQNLISVVTFDVGAGGGPVSTTSAVGLGGTVYASADSLYIASTCWFTPRKATWLAWSPTTFVYKFDLAADGVPLEATGSVAGSILNQYSMDEYAGDFRLATTDSADGLSNNVFVLARSGADLNVVGSVTGLALGERIQSVRFMGERAFVVTFRQVDPLFAIDLSDPGRPFAAGELKVPGFSTYLHPMDANHLIGFGRDADPVTGRALGLQLSLFDVTDMADPTRVAKYTFGDQPWGGYSDALWDPHAFSYFADFGVLAIPVSNSWWNGDTGLQVFSVDVTGGFTPLGEVKHDTPVQRSFQIGDYLFSISSGSIKANVINDPGREVASLDL